MPETWLDQLIYMVILLAKILVIVVPLILAVAYYTYMERKVIGAMQIRRGPNRIGPLGLAQPFADVFKLLLKEIVLPENANKFLFLLAPVLSLAPAFAAWVRVDHRRLGIELQVCFPGRLALNRTNGFLRNCDGFRPDRCVDPGRHFESQ